MQDHTFLKPPMVYVLMKLQISTAILNTTSLILLWICLKLPLKSRHLKTFVFLS